MFSVEPSHHSNGTNHVTGQVKPTQVWEAKTIKIWRQTAYNATFAMTTAFKPAIHFIGNTAIGVYTTAI